MDRCRVGDSCPFRDAYNVLSKLSEFWQRLIFMAPFLQQLPLSIMVAPSIDIVLLLSTSMYALRIHSQSPFCYQSYWSSFRNTMTAFNATHVWSGVRTDMCRSYDESVHHSFFTHMPVSVPAQLQDMNPQVDAAPAEGALVVVQGPPSLANLQDAAIDTGVVSPRLFLSLFCNVLVYQHCNQHCTRMCYPYIQPKPT